MWGVFSVVCYLIIVMIKHCELCQLCCSVQNSAWILLVSWIFFCSWFIVMLWIVFRICIFDLIFFILSVIVDLSNELSGIFDSDWSVAVLRGYSFEWIYLSIIFLVDYEITLVIIALEHKVQIPSLGSCFMLIMISLWPGLRSPAVNDCVV